MNERRLQSNRRLESDALVPALRAYTRAPQPERWASGRARAAHLGGCAAGPNEVNR